MAAPGPLVKMPNCLQGGCIYAAPDGRTCRGCGFDRLEHRRRLRLPIVPLGGGLRGIVLKGAAEKDGKE